MQIESMFQMKMNFQVYIPVTDQETAKELSEKRGNL